MSEITEYSPGTFCWVELGTTDSAGAKKFYTELFGWDAKDMPIGADTFYTMLYLNGKDVGALYKLDAKDGIPPHWLSYVSVKNANEAVDKVRSLGGVVLKPAFDVFDVGRMAVAQDPTGATFALWQAGTHIGARVTNVPGAFCWNELATNNTGKCAEFYTGLCGWSTKGLDAGPHGYTEFMNGERPAGGMLKMTEEWGGAPPHWLVYFSVEDCDATLEKAKSSGATALVPPTDIPNVGRFAVQQDPQGAAFAIIKLIPHG